MSGDGYRVAIAGATGAVGTLMLEVLRRSSLPVREVVPFATNRSEGRSLPLADVPVRVMSDETIEGFDLALFSAGGSTSREWAPRFVQAGAVVVDNSSAWRMHDDVPLVVSEVNPGALDEHQGIVANPNCTTMVAMLPLKALHDAFGLTSLVATSYQAAGGAGQKGIDELAAQVETVGRDLDLLINDGNRARMSVEHASTPTRSPTTSSRCSGRSARAATPTRSSSSRTSRARSSRSPISRSRRRASACR